MLKNFHNSFKGKMRVMGYVSGSGNTLWKTLELQKKLENTFEGSPFEIVGVFSSNPDAKAINLSEEYGVPWESIDIKKFYKERNSPLGDLETRKEYDSEAAKLIEKYNPDVILLAGYVWATTESIINNYLVVNVHPGDLRVVKNKSRIYAGADGVGDALKAKEPFLAASSHLATDELDGGPLLMISEKVEVNYELLKTMEEKDFRRHYLKLVNAQSRELGAMTIYNLALGNYSQDEKGELYYCEEKIPKGKNIDSWSENIPGFMREPSSLVNPKSVAVIGASSRGGIGYAVVNNIIKGDFKGKIYPINVKGEDVINLKGYKSILDIKEDVDVAIITIPSKYVLDIAKECGEKGVKSIVCISAGFKEVGGEGIELEKQLISIVDKYNMRLMGPNCMGILNTDENVNFNATILHTLPKKGGIGFITQSGAMGAAMLDFTEELGLGFSMVASLGNQGDINVNDLLPMFYEDRNTKVILLYLETISDPMRFLKIAKRITKEKPIVLIKSGRTSSGAKAASSHTGSLAGNDKIVDSLISACGIKRVITLEEGYLLASTLSKSPMLKGNKIAVITNAGGPGILVSDLLNDFKFEMPELNSELREKLMGKLFPEAALGNPIDIVAPAPPEHYMISLKTVYDSKQYDGAIVICVPPATVDTLEVAKSIASEMKEIDMPVIASFMGPNMGAPARKFLNDSGIPVVNYPEQAVMVLKNMLINQDTSSSFLDKCLKSPKDLNELKKEFLVNSGKYLSSSLCSDILKSYDIEVVNSDYIKTLEDINDINLKFPVVAKIDNDKIIHKSDSGGVILNIDNKDSLKTIFDMLMKKFPNSNGLVIQEQIEMDKEVIVGAIKDENVGHSLMVGSGGIMVEIFKDVSFMFVPSNRKEIENSIKKLKSYPILKGFRGEEGVNLENLIDNLQKLNQLILDFPEIEEMDINPLIYSRKLDKFIAVDYRIKVE